jgi:hypothetical protein
MRNTWVVGRWSAAVAILLLMGGCLTFSDFFLWLFGPSDVPFPNAVSSATARHGQMRVSATTGGCTTSSQGGGVTGVSCGLVVGSLSLTSTQQLKDVPPGNAIGPAYGAIVVQMPASVSNVRGTYSGAASGTLTVVAAGGAVWADNANAMVAEAGMALWVIEPPPSPGSYTFVVNLDEAGTATLPLSMKAMFTMKVAANGRTYYPPLFPCTTSFAAMPALSLPQAATAMQISVQPLLGQSGCSGKLYNFGPTVQVVEFYNQGLDHYFITWMGNEIALLDAGTTIKGWARTGQSFKAFVTAQASTTNICRIYIIPLRGDSHFFGRGQQECASTMAAHPDFVLEDSAFMAMFLPAAGNCPQGTVSVFRVFSNRPDANHRYMTDAAIRTLMVGRGWLAEGDGPNLVVMCAPA